MNTSLFGLIRSGSQREDESVLSACIRNAPLMKRRLQDLQRAMKTQESPTASDEEQTRASLFRADH